MHWTSVFICVCLIGIGSNLDNTGVGIAYGSVGVRFPHKINGIINLIGLLFAVLGGYAGDVMRRLVTPVESQFIASIVLCLVGFYMIYSRKSKKYVQHEKAIVADSVPGYKTGVVLGVGLSFTNVASSLGATLTGTIPIWCIVLGIAIWGYILIWFGCVVGRKFIAHVLGNYASVISGIMLIGVGLHQIV